MSDRSAVPRTEQPAHPHAAVALRPLEEPDVDVLAMWALDAEFCAAAEWTVGLSFGEARRRQRDLVTSPPAALLRLGAWQQGRLVGYVDLHGEGTRRELGFLVGEPSRWGRGVGARVAAAGVRFGFQRLGLASIWAEALDANPRSVRILQCLGMTELGRGERHTYRGRPTFYRRFELPADDWAGHEFK